MNIHIMTRETYLPTGRIQTYVQAYEPAEYEESFNAEQRAKLDAGENLTINDGKWVTEQVNLNAVGHAALGPIVY